MNPVDKPGSFVSVQSCAGSWELELELEQGTLIPFPSSTVKI